jgi:nitrate reductase NapD
MHIAGVVVQIHPKHLVAAQSQLETLAGVEVHAVSPAGRCVVTIEGDHRHVVADTMHQVNALAGVLSACMVYEQSESESIHVEASQ